MSANHCDCGVGLPGKRVGSDVVVVVREPSVCACLATLALWRLWRFIPGVLLIKLEYKVWIHLGLHSMGSLQYICISTIADLQAHNAHIVSL